MFRVSQLYVELIFLSRALRLMIPDPVKLHGIRVDDDRVRTEGWLAIKSNWMHINSNPTYGYHCTAGPHHSLATLRALSHTCQRLRALTLPLLWSVVHIRRVCHLGKLRDVLRDAPHLALLIRHFAFVWQMNDDIDDCHTYCSEYETVLDMAFIDRGALWERTRQNMGAELKFQHWYRECWQRAYFTGEDWRPRHYEPGHAASPPLLYNQEIETLSEEQKSTLRQAERERHRIGEPPPYLEANRDVSGPDGKGEDARIKSSSDFHSAFGEIVARLASLEVFVWASPATPLPVSVLDALKQARNLKKLHLHERQGPKMKSIGMFKH